MTQQPGGATLAIGAGCSVGVAVHVVAAAAVGLTSRGLVVDGRVLARFDTHRRLKNVQRNQGDTKDYSV